MPEMLAQRLHMKSVELIKILEGRVEKLEAELHLMKTSGIAEVAVRNPSVMEYIKHWEGRAEAAEAKLAECEARLGKAVAALKECMEEIDAYIQQEYPHDHPVQERYRQRDYAANPARLALAEIKGESHEPMPLGL